MFISSLAHTAERCYARGGCPQNGSINPEETVATTNTSAVQLLRKLEGLEQRLETLAGRVRSLERHTAELDDLRREIGNLKLEVEEFREAD
jgi:predicted RNase H-like nuclease (RuvC/YqgF family)